MRKSWLLSILMVTLFLVPDIAMAGTSTGALTTVQNDLQSVISQWYSPLQAAAKDLFFAFAAIEIAILAMNHGLNRKGHEDLFGSLIKKVVTLGFFLTCIDQANVWIPAIINGLEGGVSALGVTVATPSTIAGFAEKAFFAILLSPIHAAAKNASSILSDVLDLDWTAAFSAAETFFAASNPTSLLAEMILCFVIGVLTFISILMLALELLMVTLESYLVIAFGVIVLAGGGLRYTAKYVSSYFDYAVNVGFRLLMINAIAYLVMNSMVPLMTTMMTNVVNPLQMGIQMLALGAIIALLPKKASSIATSILTGSSSFSGGELAKGMATAGVGAAAVAAAPVALAAAGGGLAVGSMGASMGGGAASGGSGALMGATQAAQAGGAAAQGGAGSMGAGMGSAGGGAGSMEGASMKSVPTPDAKGMEQMRASVQKPSASGSSTNSKSNDAPPPAEKTGKISEGSAGSSSSAGSSPSAGSEGSSSGGGESLVAEAGEAAGVAGLTAEAVAHGTTAKGASAAQGAVPAQASVSAATAAAPAAPAAKGASATQGTAAAPASGPAASTAGSSPSAGPSGGPAGDSSAVGGESSGGGESAPSESASGSLPPIDAAPVPAPSPNEQTELLRQMRDSMAQQNRPKTIGEKAKGLIGQEAKKHADGFRDDAFANTGGVSSSKLDFKHMDD